MKDPIEKRKYKRYKAPEGAIALLGDPLRIMGSIIDLGKGGLAFRYIQRERPDELSQLHILYADQYVYIDNIPFKAISDIQMPDSPISRLFPLKRCSVPFGELTSIQNSQLDDLRFSFCVTSTIWTRGKSRWQRDLRVIRPSL